MATKAQRFKAEMQRAAYANHDPEPSHASAGVQAARRGRTKDRLPNATSHNEAPRATKNSAYELETSTTARVSRKSTRKSHSHLKTDSALKMTTMARNSSPRARAARG